MKTERKNKHRIVIGGVLIIVAINLFVFSFITINVSCMVVACISALLAGAIFLMLFIKQNKYISSVKKVLSEYDASVDIENPESLKEVIEEYSSKVYEMELLKNKAETAHLQSQINPHFLYNTLDTIRGHAVMDKSYEVANMIEILARLFRYSISEKNALLTIEDELNNIQDYLTIQKYRFGDRFDVKFDIDTSDIKLLYYMVPKLILQPLVENAIKHGLEGMTSGGLIIIKIYTTQTRLYMSVEDNGTDVVADNIKKLNQKLDSCDENQLHADHGIALLNVQKRIRNHYGNEYGLHLLLGAERGVCAEIELPWEVETNS